jgi:hypothetical protein
VVPVSPYVHRTTWYRYVFFFFLNTNCFRIVPDEPGFRDENIEDAGSSGTGTQACTAASVQTGQTHVLLEVLHDLPGQDPLIPIMTIDSSKNAGGNQNLREAANQNDVVLRASKNPPRTGAKTTYGGPPGFLDMLAKNFNSCVVSHLDSFSRAAVQVPWHSVYEHSLYVTKFIWDKIYTIITVFIRNKMYTGQSLYITPNRNKIYTATKFIQTLFIWYRYLTKFIRNKIYANIIIQ